MGETRRQTSTPCRGLTPPVRRIVTYLTQSQTPGGHHVRQLSLACRVPAVTPPPHDLGAEQAALGALLGANSPELIGEILRRAKPGDYYDPRHQTVAATIRSLYEQGLPTDPIAVATQLANQGGLTRLGGAPYLHELVQSTPNVLSGPYYAGIVADLGLTRDRQVAAQRILHLLDQGADPGDEKLRAQLADLTGQILAGPDRGHETDTTELDWPTLLSADHTQTPWLVDPLLTPGAQISIIGDGKVGKSLFSMDLALHLANGHPYLNSNQPNTPLRVGYVDQENPHDELQRRLWTMGYDRPELLSNLRYQSFPRFGPLDTATGADALVRWAVSRELRVIILDTISRMISGPENDSDTWLTLYRLTMLPLKAAGISVVRLDHFGKDKDRGGRGSSAKTQDVDHEWQMTSSGGGLIRLHRSYTRNGIGQGTLLLRRTGSPEEYGTTTHAVIRPEQLRQWDGVVEPPEPPDDTVQNLVVLLDELQVPPGYGRRKVADIIQAQRGSSAKSDHLQAAINHRRLREAAGQQIIELADAPEDPTDGRWADDSR